MEGPWYHTEACPTQSCPPTLSPTPPQQPCGVRGDIIKAAGDFKTFLLPLPDPSPRHHRHRLVPGPLAFCPGDSIHTPLLPLALGLLSEAISTVDPGRGPDTEACCRTQRHSETGAFWGFMSPAHPQGNPSLPPTLCPALCPHAVFFLSSWTFSTARSVVQPRNPMVFITVSLTPSCQFCLLGPSRNCLSFPLQIFLSWPHWAACRILVPRAGIELGPWQWKHQVLSTRLPANSSDLLF